MKQTSFQLYRIRQAVVDLGWLTLILGIPLPASFCLGSRKVGRMGCGGGQDDGTIRGLLNVCRLPSDEMPSNKCRPRATAAGLRNVTATVHS